MRLIKRLREDHRFAVVMVTHDLDTLFELTDRVAVLADQRIIACDTLACGPRHGSQVRAELLRGRPGPPRLGSTAEQPARTWKAARNGKQGLRADHRACSCSASPAASWSGRTGSRRRRSRAPTTASSPPAPVSGLNPEAQVRYRGIGVGRVSTIALDPKDPRRILVEHRGGQEHPGHARAPTRSSAWKASPASPTCTCWTSTRTCSPAEKGPDGVVELPLRPAFFDVALGRRRGRDQGRARADGEPERAADAGEPQAHRRPRSRRWSASRPTSSWPSARLPQTIARADVWLSEDNRSLATGSLEKHRTRRRRRCPS